MENATGISKVTSVNGSGTYDSSYGLLYKFEYTLENGLILTANHKKETPFAVGAEVEYEVKGDNERTGKWGSIKKPNSTFTQSAPNAPQPQKGGQDVQLMIVRQSCLNRALDLCIHNSASKPVNEIDIVNQAEMFVKWVMRTEEPDFKKEVDNAVGNEPAPKSDTDHLFPPSSPL